MYLTVEELKQLDVIPEIKSSEDVKIESLISFCSALIDSFVGFSFTKEENVSIIVDGSGSKILPLPKRIYSIISVIDTNLYINYPLTDLVIVQKNFAIMNKVNEFEEGDYNIEVTGNFGWEALPPDVKDCLVRLCNQYFLNTTDSEKMERIMGPYKSEKIGNYSYELRNNSELTRIVSNDTVEVKTTGSDMVDQVLSKYKPSDFYIGVV